MKFLVSTHVANFRGVLGKDDSAHLAFCDHNTDLASHLEGAGGVQVWICDGSEVTEELLRRWLGRDPKSPKTLLVRNVDFVSHLERLSHGGVARIVDANPDPRSYKDWTNLGVTHGGSNARMFTFTEADNYNEQGSVIYQAMRYVCCKTTLEGGWAVKARGEFNAAERAWVDTFEQIPTWLARAKLTKHAIGV